ncbi:MAG: type II secretion system protein [Oscillospiraceae bacterium]
MNNLKPLNKRGMTLVEVIVAIAILSLVSLTMATGFLASTAVVRRGIDLQNSGASLAKLAEETALDTSHIAKSPVTFSTATGKSAQLYGKFIEVTDEKTGTVFTMFVME